MDKYNIQIDLNLAEKDIYFLEVEPFSNTYFQQVSLEVIRIGNLAQSMTDLEEIHGNSKYAQRNLSTILVEYKHPIRNNSKHSE